MKCEKRREEIKEENRRNYERYREGEMRREELLKTRKELEEEKGQLEVREQELEELIYEEEKVGVRKDVSAEEMEECLGYRKLTREMLEKYVDGIYVYDDGGVVMEMRATKF